MAQTPSAVLQGRRQQHAGAAGAFRGPSMPLFIDTAYAVSILHITLFAAIYYRYYLPTAVKDLGTILHMQCCATVLVSKKTA